jgi:phosphoglycerate dehydrogenase-like enzyme
LRTSSSGILVLLESMHRDAEAVLEQSFSVVHTDPSGVVASGATLDDEGVIGILTRGRGQVSAALVERFPNLRVVARAGAGLDNVDRDAVEKRGATVLFAPGSTTEATAEHTLALAMTLVRGIVPLANASRDGHWTEARQQYTGDDLYGKRWGVVGLGRIGTRVAELVTALGHSVVAWSRNSTDPRFEAASLDRLLADCQLVSLHLALNPETEGLIDADRLNRLPDGAYLINTARGGLVDESAVLAVLDSGRLGGYATDGFAVEPPEQGNRLLQHPKCLVTPHAAVLTRNTYRELCLRTARNVLGFLGDGDFEPEAIAR